MDKFEYKVLVLQIKWAGLFSFSRHWFDAEKNLGSELNSELLAPYGQEGWEVAATMQAEGGKTHKIILKRRCDSK